MQCVSGCAQGWTRSAWQMCLQLAGRMCGCEEGKATLGKFCFQIRGFGHFPEAGGESSPLFRHKLQEFPKDEDLMELVLGIFSQSFSRAFGGSSFVPAAQHHEHIPVPPQRWEPGSQTSPGADAEAGKRKHPHLLPCLFLTCGGSTCMTPETLSLLKLPKTNLESREAAPGDVLHHCCGRAMWDVWENPEREYLPKTGAASTAHVEQILVNERALCRPQPPLPPNPAPLWS